MSRCAHRPSTKSDAVLARRVNSAIGERGLRRSAARNYSAPVVTHCSIDSGVPPRDPPALLIRGVAHEVRAIGASAE